MKRLFFAFLLAAPAMAQSPADRKLIAAWDDSLQAITDPAQIISYQDRAAQGSGDLRNLRISMFKLRSGILRQNRADIDNAVDNLALDITKAGGAPWPKFVMARAFFSLEASHTLPNQTTGVKSGEAFGDAGWRYLRQAITDDQSFMPARNLAISKMVAAGDRQQHDDALEVLKVIIAERFPNPDALLCYARELERRRLYDSSLKVMNAAALAGGDFSRLSFERARILSSIGDSANATGAYWAGLDRLTPIGREMYRFDLAWILSDDSLKAFDRVPNSELKGWLKKFWAERDAAAVNAYGARLLEQMRRWTFVLQYYRSSQPWRRTTYERVEMLDFDPAKACIGSPPTDLYEQLGTQPSHPGDIRDRELLLDHRGVIYLKHGEPIARVGSTLFDPMSADLAAEAAATGVAASGNEQRSAAEQDRKFANHESWVFFIEGAWRVLHFQGSQAVGTYAPTTLRSYLPLTEDAYTALAPYFKTYSKVAADIHSFQFSRRNGGDTEPLECYQTIVAVVDTSRKDAKLATHSDSDSPPIRLPWNAVIRSFALGTSLESNGKALVTFAVNAENENIFNIASGDGRKDYPFTFRIVAYQSETDTWIQVDTTHHSISSKSLQKGWITGWFEVPLGGGAWQISVLADQGNDSSAAYMLQRNVVVDSVPGLTLSDLVVGRTGGTPWTATDKKPFALNPTSVWPGKSAAELYYEIRGLSTNEAFSTGIQVKDENGKALINLSVPAQSRGRLMYERKTIALEQLKPGNYQLIVTITSGGKSVTRNTPIIIEK